MADIHQSYEDFRLDALLQYDLAEDEEEEQAADSDSVNSGIIDEATFDELYTSIPDVIYDGEIGTRKKEAFIRSPSLMDVTKRIRSAPSRKRIQTRKVNEEPQETFKPQCNKQQTGLLQSVSMLLRPKQMNSKRLERKIEKSRSRRGIERNISSKTESTLSSFEDIVLRQSDDDLSCSLCYLDEEEDENDNQGDGCDAGNIKTLHSSASSISEVFADDFNDTGNDNYNNNQYDEIFNDKLHCSFESNGEALAEACFNIILNNNSTDTAISLDIDDCDYDEGDSHVVFTTNDPMLNRSLPIIESRGLQDLFFDDYDHNDVLADQCHRSVVSTATATNSRHRRPYTICDF
jgi:hypothetical protein